MSSLHLRLAFLGFLSWWGAFGTLADAAVAPKEQNEAAEESDNSFHSSWRSTGSATGFPRKLWPQKPVNGEPLDMHFDGFLVFLSVMVAVVGAFVTLTTSSYVQLVRSSCWYTVMVLQCGLGLGVATVWCMHFVSMRSFKLCAAFISDASMDVSFELGLTLLSAVSCWLFSCLAVHVCIGQVTVFQRGFQRGVRVPASGALLAVGIGSMHYLGMLAERGRFVIIYDGWLVLLNVLLCFVCSTGMMCIVAYLPNHTRWRCAGSVLMAILASTVHYAGMAPVAHMADSVGMTWSFFGPAGLKDVTAEASVIVSLFCDVLLMTGNAFYLEKIKDREKEDMEQELEYQHFVADAGRLMKKSRSMQFPLALIRADDFVKLGKLVSHESLRDRKLLIMLDTPRAAAKLRGQGCIIFFSHQWLSSLYPDPEGHQFSEMSSAIQALIMRVNDLTMHNIFVWVDYSSIPQCSAEQQQLAINSLPAYVSACSAFIIVAPQVLHSDVHRMCSFDSYSERFWCRLEVCCAVLTALSHHQATKSTDGSFLVTGSFARTVSLDMVPVSYDEEDDHRQRLYLAGDRKLKPLVVMGEDGLQDHFVDLLHVYGGELDCCARNHKTLTGEDVSCDKHRVVQALSGLYGTMMVQMLRIRRQNKSGNHLRRLLNLGEMFVRNRDVYFPTAYFGTRLDAMHEYVQNLSKFWQSSASSLESPSTQDSICFREMVADLDGDQLGGSSNAGSVADMDDTVLPQEDLDSQVTQDAIVRESV